MPLHAPGTDPTDLFELFRGIHATELLTAAVAHFRVFEMLARYPLLPGECQQRLGLADRPFVVLMTALRAMSLIQKNSAGQFELSALAQEHLAPGSPFDISGYISLAAENPSVLGMVERLRSNRPYGAEPQADSGTAFIFREGAHSAMEQAESARRLTLSLAGRAKNVAPYVAERLTLDGARRLLDIGGGTGIYSYALLQKYPQLRAMILDRPEVLKVAAECSAELQLQNRVEFVAGDMFRCDFPSNVDVVLLSNVLHDWDIPECRTLIQRSASSLRRGGVVVIHDVFLNDALDGPLPVALYSASLFSLTEGRAYSAGEYRTWLQEVGLVPQPVVPTLIHCGVLRAVRHD